MDEVGPQNVPTYIMEIIETGIYRFGNDLFTGQGFKPG
jgi:hypothetical protein